MSLNWHACHSKRRSSAPWGLSDTLGFVDDLIAERGPNAGNGDLLDHLIGANSDGALSATEILILIRTAHLIAQRITNPRPAGEVVWRGFPGVWGIMSLPIEFDPKWIA